MLAIRETTVISCKAGLGRALYTPAYTNIQQQNNISLQDETQSAFPNLDANTSFFVYITRPPLGPLQDSKLPVYEDLSFSTKYV